MPYASARRLALLGLGLPLWALAAESTWRCAAEASAHAPTLVELYTSEGCESCPPADRWLSALKARPEVVALAFHVDYWDRLGWADRFASPAYSQRQAQQQRSSGARFVYTPQVVVDGRDQPDWRSRPLPSPAARPAAVVQARMVREGAAYTAQVQALAGAPARLAAFWALTEDGHASAVKAGENRGTTLAHDFVVREYQPVPAWAARTDNPVTLRFSPATPADAAHPRHLNLVLVDAESGRALQALKLGC
jgi:hypothetical protein